MAILGDVSGKVWETMGSSFADGIKKEPWLLLYTPVFLAAGAVGATIDAFEREPERAIARTVAIGVTAATGGTAGPAAAAAISGLSMGTAETIGHAAEHERQTREAQERYDASNREEAERRERISKASDMDDFFS